MCSYDGIPGQFGEDGIGQLFAQFYAPLIEAIDIPQNALDQDFVLVEGD